MRIDYYDKPQIMRPMRALSAAASEGSLEPALLDLVRVRASQLNHCAHCLAMHTKEARAKGESEDRLHVVATWQRANVFTERERAALLWCEELTLLSDRTVSDDVYGEVRSVFSEEEMCQLTIAIVAINSWNRLAVGFREQPADQEFAAARHPSRP